MARYLPGQQTLILAYPCSVDSGVDPVKYCLEIYDRALNHPDQSNNRYFDGLCKRLDCERDELTSKEEVKKLANNLVKKWGHTKAIDKTNMEADFDKIYKSQLESFSCRHNSQVITELGDQHVSDIRTFLGNPLYSVPVLFIIGHALSKGMAEKLRDNPPGNDYKSSCWRWPLYDCQDSLCKAPKEVTEGAAKGDIVVFSSGLLSPNWVVDQLRMRERQSVKSTVVIIIDACFSGVWKVKISELLRRSPLRYTRVLLQTSSSANEPSYGRVFTPAFYDLQNAHPSTIKKTYPESQCCVQNPLFYDSECLTEHSEPVVEVKINNLHFRFFNRPESFNYFVKGISEFANGIPPQMKSRTCLLEELKPTLKQL